MRVFLLVVGVECWQFSQPYVQVRKKKSNIILKVEEPEVVEEKKDSMLDYFFGKPGELDADLALLGTSRRRIAQYVSLAIGVSLVGNFLGLTEVLLSTPLLADFARNNKLDTYYSVQNFKRYIDDENHLECLYPSSWLGDTSVYLKRNAQGAEALLQKRAGPTPLAAFSSPNTRKLENLSIFRSDIPEVDSISSVLGDDPIVAAQRLLDSAIAPPSSGKSASLLTASQRVDGAFTFEYMLTLPSGGNTFHNIAVIIVPPRMSQLFTFTILCPEDSWSQREAIFRLVAESFRLIK